MGEADAGDPHVEEPGIENAVSWIKSRINYFLQIRPESASVDFTETAEGRRMILDFIREPARRRLVIFNSPGGDIKVEFDIPSGQFRKVAYFLKQRTFTVGEDGSMTGLLMGEVDRNVLEHLSLVSHEILQPLLLSGRAKDPELIGKETMDVFHRFLSKLFVTVGQAKGRTLLPLPPPDLNYKDALEQRQLKDKERIHVLESCIINWTQQIKNVLRHEPPSYIHPGDIRTGTIAEFTFWRNRSSDLSSIEEQLKNGRIQKVLRVLEATKSTYEKPFQKLVREVTAAAREAHDIDLHLQPLEKLLSSFADVPLDSLGPMFKPAMHTINLIYCHSHYYNTSARLQSILEKLNNDVVHAALQYVNGSSIFALPPEQSERRLLTAIQLFARLRGTYQHYKEEAATTEDPWKTQDELVFSLTDQFVERCHDMIDLVQVPPPPPLTPAPSGPCTALLLAARQCPYVLSAPGRLVG
jgi:dynein heavy chain, axonemal